MTSVLSSRYSCLLLGARMRRIVDLAEVLEIEVRVDLRGGDARVAEHLLHRAQVAGRLQHMRGERMAQQVRMYAAAQPLFDAPLLHAQLHHARRDAAAALADEQRLFVSPGELAAHREPGLQRGAGVAA